MNWESIQKIANLVSGALIVLIGLRKISRTGGARDLDGGRVEFSPGVLTYLEPILVFIPPALATFGALRHRAYDREQEMFAALIGCAVLLRVFALPGTIIASWEGLEQVYWFRFEKRMRWGEVAKIEIGKSGSPVTVISIDGTKIVHSMFLADQPRFLQELQRHCRPDLLQDSQSVLGLK